MKSHAGEVGPPGGGVPKPAPPQADADGAALWGGEHVVGGGVGGQVVGQGVHDDAGERDGAAGLLRLGRVGDELAADLHQRLDYVHPGAQQVDPLRGECQHFPEP